MSSYYDDRPTSHAIAHAEGLPCPCDEDEPRTPRSLAVVLIVFALVMVATVIW